MLQCTTLMLKIRTLRYTRSNYLRVKHRILFKLHINIQFKRSQDRFSVLSLGIFTVVLPTEPCALRSTQPLKVSTRDFSWGKGGRCVWLTTYHPLSAETSRLSGGLNLPGSPWATSACRGRSLLY